MEFTRHHYSDSYYCGFCGIYVKMEGMKRDINNAPRHAECGRALRIKARFYRRDLSPTPLNTRKGYKGNAERQPKRGNNV